MAEHIPGQVISPNGGDAAQPVAPSQPAAPAPDTTLQHSPVAPAPPIAQQQPEPVAQQIQPVVSQAPLVPPQPQAVEPPIQPVPAPQPVAVAMPEPALQPELQQPLPAEEPAPFQQVPQDDFAIPQLSDDTDFAGQNQGQDTISWTASEYIAHQKSKNWYIGLGVATAALLAVVYVVTNSDIISMAAILLAAIVAGMYAGRPPKTQQYIIGPNGISIGQKIYAFDQLRSFSIIEEGAFSNITFMPMKRFMPAVTIYYDPADEEKIVDALSLYLPTENRRKDAIDRLTSRIKF